MSKIERIVELMKKPDKIRNIAIAAHINHGKTTFSDNLLAGAGMISDDLAGIQRVLDFADDEQKRGITIDAASVSMLHKVGNEEFVINLIDTPGHVDFGGDVTRAMRAVDGAIVLVDAVNGMMPQTETVLRQALKEKVKPILFINKVDRLIKELQVGAEKMQERFTAIIERVNSFVSQIKGDDEWKVNVSDSSVCFGSALHKWALSVDAMNKKGIGFKDVISAYKSNKVSELAKKTPLHETVLSSVVKHLPNPKIAQKYRIPAIWAGDLKSEVGKSLSNCDSKGEIVFVATKIVIDKEDGEVAAGRLFSGTIKKGSSVYLNREGKKAKVKKVFVYRGAQRIEVDEAPAGNIVGLSGLNAAAGETVSSKQMTPFEPLTHIFEPVVTKAIEAKMPSDLPRLVEVLKEVSKEDPSIQVTINEDTGENLISGMGELHLEVIENRIKQNKGIDIVTSEPIVVYKESVLKKATAEAVSPNGKNKFTFHAEPLTAPADEKSVSCKGNVFVNATKRVKNLKTVLDFIVDMFKDVMARGPFSGEPCFGIKIILAEAKIADDAGLSEIYPAAREGIMNAILNAEPVLYEPVQKVQFEVPFRNTGDVNRIVHTRRGKMLEVKSEGHRLIATAKLPVAEMFGLTEDLRNSTEGRGFEFFIDQSYEPVPVQLLPEVLMKLREKNGLAEGDKA